MADDGDMIQLNASLEEWDVTYDRDAVEALQALQQSSSELYENVRTTLQRVVATPLMGHAKTGELRGCRATHIEHLVIVWELRSEKTGNPIYRRDHLDSLDEVYLHGIKHHDQMTSIVGNRDRPVRTQRGWAVSFDRYDVQPAINRLYETDDVRVQDVDWAENTVVVRGVVTENSKTILRERLPEQLPTDAAIRVGEQRIPTESS
jgi:mRNA-degrading endonuclease YafQ of YafQ-DinJ toxin-antitoxin module